MRNNAAEVQAVEIKSAVSDVLSIEELETRVEMLACSRCCAGGDQPQPQPE